MLAVERDVKPRNMNFAKVEKRGGGAINREGAFITKNTVYKYSEIINVMLLYTSYYATILVKHHESQFSTLLNTSCYATTPDKNHKQSLLSKKLGHFMAAVWSICLVRMYDSAG